MHKKSSSIGTIVVKSLGIYFERLPMFLKYLAIPVLLQILGAVVIALGMFFIAQTNYIPAVVIITAGIVILCNAIWKYLIKMGGLILISRQIIENEPLRELNYYTRAFENRGGYVTYLLISGFLIPLIPVCIGAIGAAYAGAVGDKSLLVLSLLAAIGVLVIMCPFLLITMHSFVLNPNLGPWDSIVKGMKLSGGNYLSSWGILILYTIISIVIMGLIAIFAKMVRVGAGLPKGMDDIITQIFSQFFLPYWALCFTWWYLRLEKENRTYGR